ncbi:MAG: pantetheine-phosphate adenylyltransferase [bacterium]|jgi:pantetheine-phosphate adenylyltransferase
MGNLIAVYPGSFDPVTNGHIDIVERAAAVFDTVIIAVFVNSNKKPLFTMDERVEILQAMTAHLPNVQVDSFQGLLSDYVRANKARVIIRGLRGVADFEIESQMALMNKKLNPRAETIFMMASSRNIYISSSIIKEVAKLGGCVSGLVPNLVEAKLREKFGDNKNS